VKISHIDYSDLSEVARTKSGKRAALKQTRKPTAKSASKKCPTGKNRMKDHKQAVHPCTRQRELAESKLENNGSTNRQECRTYFCGMCKGHHLTSKREWSTFSGPVAA
jgi:hypothetical protein